MEHAEQTSGSSWDQVVSIGDLQISFTNNAGAHDATIYGNGVNQVGVSVAIEALDANRQPVVLSASDLWNVLSFRDYSNPQDLINGGKNGWVNNEGWWVTNQPSAYTIPVSFDSSAVESAAPLVAGYSGCQCYIFWDPSETTQPTGSKDFAVQVTLANGLTYSTGVGNGSLSNYMHVDAIAQIKYTVEDIVTDPEQIPDTPICAYYYSIDQTKHYNNNIIKCDNIDPVSNDIFVQSYGVSDHITSPTPGVFLEELVYHNVYNDNLVVLWQYGESPSMATIPYTQWSGKLFTGWTVTCLTCNAIVNNKKYAVCKTISTTDTDGFNWAQSGGPAICFGRFTIYDQYGNTGNFQFDQWSNLQNGNF